MAANDRTGVGRGTGSWQTPDDIYLRYHRRFRFTYDPFASHDNAKCDLYSTVDGTFRKCSCTTIGCPGYRQISDRDGLAYPWTGQSCFCNPPYTSGLIMACTEKMISERDNAARILALVSAATETAWFQLLAEHSWIEYLRRRVRYIHPPFPCSSTCSAGRDGKHVFGAPGVNSPGGAAVALLRADEAFAWR